MKKGLVFTLASLFLFVAQVHAAKESIKLELSVASAFSPYSDVLFETPAYAALAFQNSGMPVSLSRPLRVLSSKELQIGTEKLIFERKKGKVYTYKAIVGLPFGNEISTPVEIDASELERGKLIIYAYPAGAGLIPKSLIEKVESKLQTLANANAQKNLFNYLSVRTKGNLDSIETKSQLFSQITFDAINQINQSRLTASARSDVGQAESISSQWSLIIAFVIWCIGLPVGLFLIRRHRLKSHSLNNTKELFPK